MRLWWLCLTLCCCGCAVGGGTSTALIKRASDPGTPGMARLAATAPTDSGLALWGSTTAHGVADSFTVAFSMPTVHTLSPFSAWPDSTNPIAYGAYRWDVGVSWQVTGIAWLDSIRLQPRGLRTGYAYPGDHLKITDTKPPGVLGVWVRTWTGVPGPWQLAR